MNRCKDYSCCGHGPAPLGDSGGCPDEEGRFDCDLCSRRLPKGVTSSICNEQHERWQIDAAFNDDSDLYDSKYYDDG